MGLCLSPLIQSLSDLLWDLFTNQRLTINTTIPAGIVNRRRKIAGLPPNKSTSIYIIGQNATHAEIIEIITILRRVLGRFMASTTRGGEYSFLRYRIPLFDEIFRPLEKAGKRQKTQQSNHWHTVIQRWPQSLLLWRKRKNNKKN